MTDLNQAIRAWFSTRLETMPCDDDLEAHESLQMAAHAVIAVLDLHAESAPGAGGGLFANPRSMCEYCYEGIGSSLDDGMWPCPTLLAIAEKLGIEHG